MGTWDSSRFQISRRERPCHESRMPVPHQIAKGERYLVYKLGQRNDVAVCVRCATTASTMTRVAGGGYDGPHLKYDCQAVQDEIKARAAESDAEMAGQGSPI